MRSFLLRYKKFIPALLFSIFILNGVFFYRDFGLSTDESLQRNHGIVTYRWINKTFFHRDVFVTEGTDDLEHYEAKYYGVAIQLPLVAAEDLYCQMTGRPMDAGTIYHMRHLYTYGFFVLGLYCFYRILKDLFHSEGYAVIGVLMIYTFGRFFSDAFYNIKDMMFTSLFTISLYHAERVLMSGYDRKWCLLFAVSAAFTVSSRIVGAVLPLLLLVVTVVTHAVGHKRIPKTILLVFLAYPIWLVITPASWVDPVRYSLGCVFTFSDYKTWTGFYRYAGAWLSENQTPFDYYLRWIGMTVPLVYLLFILYGAFCFLLSCFRYRSSKTCPDGAGPFLFIAIFIPLGTIAYQMIKRPTVYDGWRHVYFLYPCMIIFAVYGLKQLQTGTSARLKTCALALLYVSMAYNTVMMIKNHPAQFAAYNLIGQRISADYDGDYWGLSIFPQLRWIAETNSDVKSVSIYEPELWRLQTDHELLSEDERAKILITDKNADYIIVWRLIPLDRNDAAAGYVDSKSLEGYKEVHPIISYGSKISSVFQRIDD